jgi:hypothetical protein
MAHGLLDSAANLAKRHGLTRWGSECCKRKGLREGVVGIDRSSRFQAKRRGPAIITC